MWAPPGCSCQSVADPLTALQCQYTFLHQCVRDVLRARKHRGEQENPLYPIYENFNPEYCRGETPPPIPSLPPIHPLPQSSLVPGPDSASFPLDFIYTSR